MPDPLVRVDTTASKLKAGDTVFLQGLVIAVDYRFNKIKVTFKGRHERIYPNDQVVQILLPPTVVTSAV
jgi:tartrate dehydratase beta subunit/fumarate hydratase class I family protein